MLGVAVSSGLHSGVGHVLPFLHFRYLLFQLLAKLLKSKNPDDLQEANKLIKSMVKEVSGSWSSGHGTQKHVTTEQKSFPRDHRPVLFTLHQP